MRAIVKIYCNRCRTVRNYLCQIGTAHGNVIYVYECLRCGHKFSVKTPLPDHEVEDVT